MKTIILAGLGAKKLPSSSIFETSIAWIINSLNNSGLENINIVAGKEIEKIGYVSKNTNLLYNRSWSQTGPIESLLLCENIMKDSDILISFGDVVYNTDLIKNFLNKIDTNKINILTDNNWLSRFKRSQESIEKAEKIEVNKEGFVIKADRNFKNLSKVSGEFTGLCFVNKESVSEIISIIKSISSSKPNTNKYPIGFMDLFTQLVRKKYNLKNHYTEGNWAELDHADDFHNFIFGNKSKTLYNLKGQLKKGKILTQVFFNIDDWKNNKSKIIKKIKAHFINRELIVRSSSAKEDSLTSSMAGKFTSVLGVNRDSNSSIEKAVLKVIDSYGSDQSSEDVVFVQPSLPDVTISGVIFTCELKTGAPYYCVNYTESEKTDLVTSGSAASYFLFYHLKSVANVKNKLMNDLIQCAFEIEKLVGNNLLDIEFAFDKSGQLYIFQVRPITSEKAIDGYGLYPTEENLNKEVESLKKVFATKKNTSGKTTVLGKMPDWNPAELIGSRPKPLSLSLYHELITKKVWRKARKEIGYYDPSGEELLVEIRGQPFIDVRNSLNSFTPKSMSKSLRKKLTDESITFLTHYPHLHDKLEFDVATTCYTPYFNSRIKRWIEFGFSSLEIEEMRESFKTHTEKIITGKWGNCKSIINEVEILDEKRREILFDNSLDNLFKSKKLIDICSKLGTMPFSKLARYAFIGNTLLKSFVDEKVLSENSYNQYLNSIETVATELFFEIENLRAGKIRMQDFLDNFGHLRPGTFDINSFRYDEKPELYFDLEKKVNKQSKTRKEKFIFSKEEIMSISFSLKKIGMPIDSDSLFSFIEDSIKGREYSKFIFSRSISDSLRLLMLWGKDMGFSREDLSFVDVNSLFNLNFISDQKESLKKLKNIINLNKKEFMANQSIVLPELIFNPKNILSFFLSTSQPNFITNSSVTGKCIKVHNNSENTSLDGKIVLIESADPGYDWIFTHRIKGLVTKYGGAASHMAIRCSEFNLPAAIGCGSLFDSFNSEDIINLDSMNNSISKI